MTSVLFKGSDCTAQAMCA